MSRKILFVDNETEIIETFKFVIERSLPDYEFVFSQSGYEAMRLIEDQEPNLVLSDYRMEGGDGGTLAHFCKDLSVPCVILTGFSPSDVVPYLPEGTQVVGKTDLLKNGRFKELVDHLFDDVA
ncbi:response regulator [Pseudobacteriovorax antillogorgiicola]|uniref:Response regulator receiver domain-containing protein n=1 Tax=Pseudobacteriovorax antillogorgiicola TaxID=1513793 RepID=A0A1Y6CQ38_9BACT|nr:response regulator [Pseudobacteriovorax antillogorgiicola]TCS43515.1 response regulator receiver domain-containing protein [Pseudobacteriovorax antillogorgiicola]SMF81064.1 Response regulator receiver domain-containing protein [Pseudobacteriovorax antillogorgiicola]